MKRYVSDRGHRPDRTGAPGLPKVEKAELSEKNIGLRIAVIIAALALGLAALTYGFLHLVGTESGWQEITISSDTMSCGGDFTFLYPLGENGKSAKAEAAELREAYTKASVEAWQLFNADEEPATEEVVNLYTLNHAPNQTFAVEPALFQCLKHMAEDETRSIYGGPIYELLTNIFTCETDEQAREMDPAYNSEMAELEAEIKGFTEDNHHIRLEFPAENQVCLRVSEEYMAYAEENGIEHYLDLYRLRNAFTASFIGEELEALGYVRGILASYDGFVYYLGGAEDGSEMTVYHLQADGTVTTEKKDVSGRTFVINLYDFPVTEKDNYYYYVYKDGEIRTPFTGDVSSVLRGVQWLEK